MLNSKPLKDIIFLDIETVPQYETFNDMPARKQILFEAKYNREIEQMSDVPAQIEEFYTRQASFIPELGKIACISIGKILPELKDDKYQFKMASFTGEDDSIILTKFLAALPDIKSCKNPVEAPKHFCAHYGKVFDYPFIAKRMIINQIPLPPMFDYGHLKPWEMTYLIDTIDAWRFGRMDCNASLDMLADVLQVDSPKTDMDGDMVKKVFYEEKNLPKIASYCEGDVFALAQIY